ncbi:type II toxin-antitoxin system PemK/MazF family toxin [Dyadobacter aurulentus]|uniref:type II toxin-antitoxin system PemK/MazF family toxin n=1 Tax=Dyadobacter sp. UC 10 TaxID=2605428 RepID=UPI0011F3C5F9|nr:type II toxin-antitoxin system PemK/MazF family toxin [Dyadobacter sp. UC 10]KAA0991968.1 type II toxin-antitoxin system PemK/MazF family toxin [Dyadobacter sp. UC 10]
MVIKRYDVYWISLDPTQGSEISKIRPCLIVSPDELNQYLRTVVILPITSTIKNYPWRVDCTVQNQKGSIAADQIRVVDKSRLGSKIGNLSAIEIKKLKQVMQEMLGD